LVLLLTEGQVSDCRGASTVLADLHDADASIADTCSDSDRFREAPTGLRIERCAHTCISAIRIAANVILWS